MFRVNLSFRAKEFYARAELSLARKLVRCFRQLELEPRRHSNVTALKGKLRGNYRFRVGDYRVVYTIDYGNQVVNVVEIGHRREVYDDQ